ncbi:MAG: 50S ribosomal protein L32 [Dehalococcoidales bacterium]|jgi:large subunit ribosomal protein L32|nr:50S ribosomal protein L32 [Dehalococcoidales bacterium]MDD5604313.1 50S ribosomal protein L32 [Dehalococcoidales bacterium]MDX9985919.1 50S ribosomal protein L32 [Dehalococcoidales bacterium]
MGALPKRKTSKARKNERRSHIKTAEMPTLVECPECHTMRLPHNACPVCGTYKGREVIEIKQPKSKTE